MKTQKEWQDDWFKALRSGQYKQSKGILQNEDRYCCLGVAFRLVYPDAPEPEEANLIGPKNKVVKDTFGFKSCDGDFDFIIVVYPDGSYERYPNFDDPKLIKALDDGKAQTVSSLVTLNDYASWSFEQIANFAEKYRDRIFDDSNH